jgi:hypothetical protein
VRRKEENEEKRAQEDVRRKEENEEKRRQGKGKEIPPEQHQARRGMNAKKGIKQSRREVKSREIIQDSDEEGPKNGPSTVRPANKQRTMQIPWTPTNPVCVSVANVYNSSALKMGLAGPAISVGRARKLAV